MSILIPLRLLMYLALLLVPKSADHITLTGPGKGERYEMVLTDQGWRMDGNRVWIDKDKLYEESGNGATATTLDQVGGVATHDWEKLKVLDLDSTFSLEKTGDGYLLRVKNSRSTDGYRISYSRTNPPPEKKEITVNVLGEVVRPGSYKARPGASVIDAIALAGGWAHTANTRKISLVRGPAGEIPKVTIIDATAILEGRAASPSLEEGDVIYLVERMF